MNVDSKTTIVNKLSSNLLVHIKTADEIWVAVALMSIEGLRFLIDNLKSSCRQNYLIGVDLPTDPIALKKLNELQLKFEINVRLHTENECFHPKLYLLKKNNNYVAFVGSANCTNGGLFNNVELTICINDQPTCIQLYKWFEVLFNAGKSLTTKFIDQYTLNFLQRKERKKQEEKFAKEEKKVLNEEIEANLSEKNKLIKILKKYRNNSDYQRVVNERKETINNLRTALDYPNFNKINIDKYFTYWELGHLIPIAKPAIKRHIPELKILLTMLCDESKDIEVRYNAALIGDLKIEGISKAFISKVLIIHRPDLYFVKNGKSEKALRKYGIQLPRGLTEGEKYKYISKFLQQICKETDIKDLAVLDNYLYLEGNDN